MTRRTVSFACLPTIVFFVGMTALIGVLAVPAVADPITYEMVAVGNPGNAGDTRPGANTFGKGSVAYPYQIGKYDVTIGQYAAFLNAVAATDTYSLYNSSMGSDGHIAGIQKHGSLGSYTYSVITPSGTTPPGASSPGNRPITYVSWWSAARFSNWIANGQPTGAQSSTTTENGAYNLANWTSGTVPARNLMNPNTGAPPTFFIPSENEWYKAAYYSPNYGGVGNPGYYAFATQSDAVPGNLIGGAANQANYLTGAGYSVTQSLTYDDNQNYLTDVGAFTNSASFYGTFDQSGNVFQWNDLDGLPGTTRGLRGGVWQYNDPVNISSSYNYLNDPSGEYGTTGFRLASPAAVPEPSMYAMALAGLAFGMRQVFRSCRA